MDMTSAPVLFSIIVPIYGVEAFLPHAIESVLAQSCPNWELILVDDGSPDRCGEICDRYVSQDARIRVIHKDHGGVARARRDGYTVAQGEYVLCLDGDDYWEPQFLSDLKYVIENNSPDGICFGYRRVTEDGEPLFDYFHKPDEGIYSGEGLRTICSGILHDPENPDLNTNHGYTISTLCASAFRRSVVEPFAEIVPTQLSIGEDAAVMIPAMCRCRSVYFMRRAGYNYRIRSNSITYGFCPSEIQNLCLMASHLEQYADGLPLQNILAYLYRRANAYWIMAAKKLPNYHQFRSCVAESLVLLQKHRLFERLSIKMTMKNRLLFWVEKYSLWWVLWLYYHKKTG